MNVTVKKQIKIENKRTKGTCYVCGRTHVMLRVNLKEMFYETDEKGEPILNDVGEKKPFRKLICGKCYKKVEKHD